MELSANARAQLAARLNNEEGERKYPYVDIKGKITIGRGHNLTDNGLSQNIINAIFEEDLTWILNALPNTFGWYNGLSDNRKIVVADMCFNLGLKTFEEFVKTIHYISIGDFEMAAKEMLDSPWANQVGQRAQDLARIMRTDEL